MRAAEKALAVSQKNYSIPTSDPQDICDDQQHPYNYL